jgi:hypothetical protein
MKKASFAVALLAGGLLLQACDSNNPIAPDSAAQTTTTASARLGGGSYKAHLTGDQEVPSNPLAPPVVTNATGQINLKLSADGTELYYKLIVANIESVRFAHLHQAAVGANGPVVVDLFMPMPLIPVISPQGVLAEGVITAASLKGPLAGKTLADLVAAIEAGNIYANVHSIKYPGGELRGQVD